MVVNRVRVLGIGPHIPTQYFGEYPLEGWEGGAEKEEIGKRKDTEEKDEVED